MKVRRGDLIVIAVAGDYGNPRPALVIQADEFQSLDSVTVLRLSSDLRDWPSLRVTMEPNPDNGLRKRSQVMIDKATVVHRKRIGQRIGRADPVTMRAVDRALAGFLGLAPPSV
jgi:mRNA interferase MazF